MKPLRKYWGYLLLIVIAFAWASERMGPLAIIFTSLLACGYFLFQAPAWCGALNRDGTSRCRNNSKGLLLGCAQVRQHKWQRFTDLFGFSSWVDKNRCLWNEPRQLVITATSIATIFSAIAGAFK